MVNVNLLKGLLRENGDTLKDYAVVIDKSVTTVQERFKNAKEFTRDEIYKTKKHYKLSDERFISIFFDDQIT